MSHQMLLASAQASAVIPSPVRERRASVTTIPGMAVSNTLHQQGDVLIQAVGNDAWPEAANLRKRVDRRLAVSASTGFSHEADAGELYEFVSYGNLRAGELWLDAPQGAVVRHHEHQSISLPPGRYRIYGVLEYDPFEAEGSKFAVRRVVD